MEQVCHRCGATLNGSDPFCPHCGAPQLRYEAPEEPSPSASASPAQRLSARNPNVIAWQDAILTAALIALPAGLLSSLLGFEALWVIAGGMMTISLYRRRTGTLPSGKMGWRIGMLFGLFASVVAAAINGITLLVQRYALHQGAVLDQRYHDLIQMNSKLYGNLFAVSNPDVAAAIAQAQHFWLTPDGAAAMMLANTLGLVITMLIFAAAGGALGARLNAKAPQHSAR
jgi:ribosomal protein L40E